MARRTVRIAGKDVPTLAFWVVGVAAFVLIVPMLTFYFREQFGWFGGAAAPAAPTPGAIRQTGVVYTVDNLFDLESDGMDAFLPRSLDPETGYSPFLEVVAPTPDGGVWVVHHPPESGVTPYVRHLARDGSILASFEVTSGATLFTPGPDGDLWVDVASGAGDQEHVVHYGATGEMLHTFPVPAGLFARSIELDPDGGVWALAEEWSVDGATRDVNLQSALVPIAIGDPLEIPLDPTKLVLDGTFWGDDGLLYRLRSSGVIPEGLETPPYEVTSWTRDGEQIASYSLPANVRPFAADSSGRLYAEPLAAEKSIADGLSTLGDPANETTLVWIIDRSGGTTKLPVWRQTYFSNWAPSAWPRPDGTLLTTSQALGSVEVLELTPGAAAASEAEEPFVADLTIIEPVEPLFGDPYAVTDDAQRDVMRLLYSGLVTFDAALQPVPDLAEAVPTQENGLVSADGLTIRWEIKDGITWHDGESVTADDVVATWRYLSEGSYLPHGKPFIGFDAITDVTADGRAVVVTLSRPIGAAPTAFFPYVLPGHLLPQTPTANPPMLAAPVGCGPYRLVRWEDGAGWYLKAHEGASRSVGEVRSVHVVFAQGDAARAAFDAATGPVVWDWVDEIRTSDLSSRGIAVAEYASGRWWGTVFDSSAGPTSDSNIRAALIALYPRETIATQVYQSSETSVPVDPYPALSLAHDPTRPPTFGDDTARAGALFASSGWQLRYHELYARDVLMRGTEVLSIGGHHTHREWNDSEVPPDAADAVQMAWRAAGILDSYNFASMRHYESWWRFGFFTFDDFGVGAGVFPSAIDPGWGGIFDPGDEPSVMNPYGIGITGSNDEVLATLYAEAEAEYDPLRRAEIGRQITKRAFDELHLAIGERYEMRRIAISGAVTGFEAGALPSGAFSVVSGWRVGEAEQ